VPPEKLVNPKKKTVSQVHAQKREGDPEAMRGSERVKEGTEIAGEVIVSGGGGGAAGVRLLS